MDINKRKENLSIGYLQIVAAAAGIAFESRKNDENGIDVILTNYDFREYDVNIFIQLKSTSSKSMYKEHSDKFTYKLKAKNYNDLTRQKRKGVLCVLILPKKQQEWVNATYEQLTTKYCMYFKRFINETEIKNTASKTVDLSKNNFLSPRNLKKIFKEVYNEI